MHCAERRGRRAKLASIGVSWCPPSSRFPALVLVGSLGRRFGPRGSLRQRQFQFLICLPNRDYFTPNLGHHRMPAPTVMRFFKKSSRCQTRPISLIRKQVPRFYELRSTKRIFRGELLLFCTGDRSIKLHRNLIPTSFAIFN